MMAVFMGFLKNLYVHPQERVVFYFLSWGRFGGFFLFLSRSLGAGDYKPDQVYIKRGEV
jgi:hypothetical protein